MTQPDGTPEDRSRLLGEFLDRQEAEWEAMSPEERAEYEEESIRFLHAIARPRPKRIRRSELDVNDYVVEIIDEEWLIVERQPTLAEVKDEHGG